MQDVWFVNRTELTEDIYYEAVRAFNKKANGAFRKIAWALFAVASVGIAAGFGEILMTGNVGPLWEDFWRITGPLLFVIVTMREWLWPQITLKRTTARTIRLNREAGLPMAQDVTVGDAGILVESAQSRWMYRWDQCSALVESEHAVSVTVCNMIIILDKAGFSRGDEQAFPACALAHLPRPAARRP